LKQGILELFSRLVSLSDFALPPSKRRDMYAFILDFVSNLNKQFNNGKALGVKQIRQ